MSIPIQNLRVMAYLRQKFEQTEDAFTWSRRSGFSTLTRRR